jgi:hypothetical protein
MTDGRVPNTRNRTSPNATLSTTNPSGLDGGRTWTSAVRDRRLTGRAMARPDVQYYSVCRLTKYKSRGNAVARNSVPNYRNLWDILLLETV